MTGVQTCALPISEFERCAESVSDAGADDRADAALGDVGTDVVSGDVGEFVVCVHGKKNARREQKCVAARTNDIGVIWA